MATKRICSIEGCGKPHEARGLCFGHYRHAWRAKKLPPSTRLPVSAPVMHLQEVLVGDTTDCVVWPFRRREDGSAIVFFDGRCRSAARVMCEMRHGAPPEPEMISLHSCGNGHLGCINPNHLRWGTHADNTRDKISHGAACVLKGVPARFVAKLTPENIAYIRSSDGEGKTVAHELGVSPSTVSRVRRHIIYR